MGFKTFTSCKSRVFQTDCPDGELYKDKVLEMYSMIVPTGNASVLVDHIYRIFDKDGNGSIDFKVNYAFKINPNLKLSCVERNL